MGVEKRQIGSRTVTGGSDSAFWIQDFASRHNYVRKVSWTPNVIPQRGFIDGVSVS